MKYKSKEELLVLKRVNYMAKDQVNWFAPTISPAPKDYERKEIESLSKAIEYYSEFTDKVILQPKFMGSYCCVYLNKDINLSKFQSKNGYIIKHVERSILIETIKDLHFELFKHNDATEIIVEGELLPWSLMGRGLIDKEFGNYYNLHKFQDETLINSNIVDKIESEGFIGYLKDPTREYPQHIKRQYESFKLFKGLLPQNYNSSLDIYKRQLELFGSESTPKFEPFNILKIDNNVQTDNTSFLNINKNECLILDVNKSIEENHKTAYEYFNKFQNAEWEGIVVKPVLHDLENVVPCFKVRTNNYLQLIYGIRFQELFNYYFEKRNVKWKMKCSLKDYQLGRQLLRLKKEELREDNKSYKLLLTKLITNESVVKSLDSRL